MRWIRGVKEMSESVISVTNLGYKAGYRYLLKDINWQVKKGEHWVVFGMNGSGKTTLLSIISGFKHLGEGRVEVFGKALSNDNILAVRKRIGWVSSSFFDKHYSKESALNIVLSGINGTLGLDETITLEDVKLAKALLTELHLGDKVDHTFDMFSKGERQNILIARALISNPDILILDEPCTGLDVYNRSYLFSTIEELSKQKELTIIYVTHYVEEIIPLFDKILFLKNGTVFEKGDLKTLMTDTTISRLLDYPVEVFTERDGTYRLNVHAESAIADLLK